MFHGFYSKSFKRVSFMLPAFHYKVECPGQPAANNSESACCAVKCISKLREILIKYSTQNVRNVQPKNVSSP